MPDERLFLQTARNLRARWVVSGGFQRSLDAVRVTASLTDVVTGELIRTTRVDGRVDAIFDLQDRLVREVATLRAPRLAVNGFAQTEVVSAYEAFSRGLVNRRAESFESLERAVILFERAVELNPRTRARTSSSARPTRPRRITCPCRSRTIAPWRA